MILAWQSIWGTIITVKFILPNTTINNVVPTATHQTIVSITSIYVIITMILAWQFSSINVITPYLVIVIPTINGIISTLSKYKIISSTTINDVITFFCIISNFGKYLKTVITITNNNVIAFAPTNCISIFTTKQLVVIITPAYGVSIVASNNVVIPSTTV